MLTDELERARALRELFKAGAIPYIGADVKDLEQLVTLGLVEGTLQKSGRPKAGDSGVALKAHLELMRRRFLAWPGVDYRAQGHEPMEPDQEL